jgi:nuclear cap-binding protein subunit 1
MADHDRRHHGGYNNRKRRYRDDDDHYDRRYQRRRTDTAPAPVRMRRQLLALADSPLRQWSDEVQGVARIVVDNYEDEHLRNTFVELVLQLLVEQPLKTPFVAAVVLVANAHKSEIAEVVLTRAAQATETSIAKGEWREVKLYLKFLACLQSCMEGDGLFPLLEELFARAAHLQTASSDDVSALGLAE